MWRPIGEPWQYRVLDLLPPGVDAAQLDAALRMTPTERVEAMVQLVRWTEDIQRARKLSSSPAAGR